MNQQPSNIKKHGKLHKKFQSFADSVNGVVGSPYWFVFSVIMVITWFFSGFFLNFSETWQLMINTTTTILTFLMISLLHSSQKKWEDKIERLQDREASTIKEIHKQTKRISLEAPSKPEENSKDHIQTDN